ncbi:MAG: hypothetical protein MR038_03815 [Oscillospiraceae bacterium]|nr:hypothetical protein [Oscillospiraceae bacterium]
MEESEIIVTDTAESAPDDIPAEKNAPVPAEPDFSEENRRLKLELECAELGVRKECRGDVIRLAEDSSISEVLRKYPVFIGARNVPDTGVVVRNEPPNEDISLRKAFGLL